MVTVEPLMDTWPSETGMVATVMPSDFLMMKSPVPATMVSEKVRTMLASMATAVASSAGVDELSVGAVVSAVAELTDDNTLERPDSGVRAK